MPFTPQSIQLPFPRTALYSAMVVTTLLTLGLATSSSSHADDIQPTQSANTSDVPATADRVVVVARKREELAQNVPVPVSVIGGTQIDRDSTYTIQDLTEKAPGLTATTPNARRTGISIRGIGKASGNDNMQAAVGVIVDDVALTHVGMSYQDFTDLDHVEVLRGPQGTLLGKNTTMGAINYVSKLPSFTPHGSISLGGGLNKDGLQLNAEQTDAIIDDVLAYRASFFVDQQRGDLKNVSPAGGYQQEKNRYGGRVQFLWKPADNLKIRLNLDEALSNEYGNTKPYMADPTTFANGASRTANNQLTFSSRISRSYFGNYTPIIGGDQAWDNIDTGQAKPLITKNSGESLIVDWDLGGVTLKSITADRRFHFDATNDTDQTKFAINQGGTLVDHTQFSQEFRLSSDLGKALDYQLGLYFVDFNTDSTSRSLYGNDAGAFYASNSQYSTLISNRALLSQSLNNVYSTTLVNPHTQSGAAFGQANWHLTDKATVTFGLRDTIEENTSDSFKAATFADGSALTSTGNATADAIRSSQLGTVYGLAHGQAIHNNSVSWLINPSYQLTPDTLLYTSASAGQKSGSVQFTSKGGDLNVSPERSLDFELGVKSLLLDRRLLLNVNLYQTDIKDYQATTSIIDPTSSTGYSSVLGNIPGIQARGVEIEGGYVVNPAINLNFATTYNHAIYSDWSTATCPAEIVTQTVCNNTGKQIVGAPKYTVVLGPDYHPSLGIGTLSFHAYLNGVYRSEQNLDSQLSIYGRQAGYSVLDGGFGIVGHHNKTKYELDLTAKNITDKHYTTSETAFSNSSPVGYDGIGQRRYVSLVLRASY